MNETNWKIAEQHDETQINQNNTWEETKTLTSRDLDKAICEICGISNHDDKEEENETIITVFSKGTENKAFCEDCLYNLH